MERTEKLYKEERPWGKFEVLKREKDYVVKELVVKPNGKTSLQYHNYRDEYWIVVRGCGKAIIGEKSINLKKGDIVKVPVKEKHRIVNDGDEELVIIEVWLGEKLEEDDIVRLEDEYGRK